MFPRTNAQIQNIYNICIYIYIKECIYIYIYSIYVYILYVKYIYIFIYVHIIHNILYYSIL